MPDQILPLTGLDQTGVILDTPPVALPPTAFSDCLNVRFKDGAVRKMEGELNIFPDLVTNILAGQVPPITDTAATIKYTTWWANPNLAGVNSGYYLVIIEHDNGSGTRMDFAYVVAPDGSFSQKGSFPPDQNAAWQHTFFQGGFCIIINNGLVTPNFIIDTDGNTDITMVPDFAPLPGWDSYLVDETIVSDTYNADENTPVFDLPQPVDITERNIRVTRTRAGVTETVTVTAATPTDYNDSSDNFFFRIVATGNLVSTITFQDMSTPPVDTVMTGDIISIRDLSKNPVTVTAGVIRSFGDFLVAGNLVERDEMLPANPIIRNLTGVVRASDVAAPGQIPTNWNPFAAGVSTADEFVLSDTGVVQDMAELQGNLYIYSNTSITVMRQTGNAAIPLATSPVTDSYGAQTTGAVLEFDGQHFVVGSQDVYIFGGHPGSIQSIADARVRRVFFQSLNPLHESRLFCLRYQQRDEIWICFPTTRSITGECDRAYIWNYRSNTWTIRSLDSVVSGNVGPVPGGGVPNSTITFDEMTGENSLISAGLPDIQTLSLPAGITAPTARPQRYNIDVLDTLSGFSGIGPEIFELNVPNNFNPGTTPQPVSFIFTVSNEGSFITNFPLRVQLMSTDTTAALIATRLEADDTFAMYYTAMAEPTDSNLLRITANGPMSLTDHDQHTLNINATVTDRNALTQVMPPVTLSGTTDASGAFSEFFDSSFVGMGVLAFIDEATGTPLPAGTQLQEGPDPGGQTRVYTDTPSTSFYDRRVARGSFFGTTTTTYTSIEQPLMVTSTGTRYFRLVDAAGAPLMNRSYVFTAFETADTSDAANIPTLAQQIPAVTMGTPPVLSLMSQVRTYDVSMDSFEPSGAAQVIDIMLLGNQQGPDRQQNVARAIRDGLNATSIFTAEIDPMMLTRVMVSTTANEKRTLTHSVTDSSDTVVASNFIIPETFEGIYSYGVNINQIQPIGPTFTVTGPEGFMATEVTVETLDDGSFPAEAILVDLVTPILVPTDPNDMFSGWTRTDMDTTDGSITLQTVNRDNVPIGITPQSIFTEEEVQYQDDLAQREVASPWTFTLLRRGNIDGIPNFGTVIADRTRPGVYPVFNTPSFLGLLISIGDQGEQEFITLRAGALSANTPLSSAQVAEQWATQLRAANRRLNVTYVAGESSFTIQPVNYDELANFVLEAYFNIDAGMANTIQMLRARAENPNDPLRLNPFSQPLYFNPGSQTLVVNSSGGAPASLETTGAVISTNFDVLRPWPTDEINPNQEFPLLSARQRLDVLDDMSIATGSQTVNKVIGADLGWSRPMYSLTASMNDSPQTYESYIERVQLPLTPEFNTEQVQSVALWADGGTVTTFRQPEQYNQLDIRVSVSDHPGDRIDLSDRTMVDTANIFPISEEYKSDLRVHGRFSNIRITDDIPSAMFTTTINGKTFTQQSEWRLSGIQIEFAVGGRR